MNDFILVTDKISEVSVMNCVLFYMILWIDDGCVSFMFILLLVLIHGNFEILRKYVIEESHMPREFKNCV